MSSPRKTPTQALKEAMLLCSKEEKCSYDIKKKLLSWGMSKEETVKILQQLTHEKYIDDIRYAKSFANDKLRYNKWGRIKIAIELKKRKVQDIIIQEALGSIDKDEYRNILAHELKKKAGSIRKAPNTLSVTKALYRFALNRGFEQDEIQKILENTNYERQSTEKYLNL